MSQDYDLERLNLFIDTYGFRLNPKPDTPDPDMLHAAACALMDALWYGVDLRKELGIARKRGQRGKGRRGGKVKHWGREVTETARYLSGYQTYTQARDRIAAVRSIDERQAEKEMIEAAKDARTLINLATLWDLYSRQKDQ